MRLRSECSFVSDRNRSDALSNPDTPLDRQVITIESDNFADFVDDRGNVLENAYERIRTHVAELADAADDDEVRRGSYRCSGAHGC